MLRVPECARTRLTVVAVREQSPEARVFPLLVGPRLRKPTHRVHDDDVSLRLESHCLAVAVEIPLQLPPTRHLQEVMPAVVNQAAGFKKVGTVSDWRPNPPEQELSQRLAIERVQLPQGGVGWHLPLVAHRVLLRL